MDASKLCLGTAQLGMRYGIANQTGRPDQREAFRILDTAWDFGIRRFDTAALYGDSEALLGQWIKARGRKGEIRVVSKIPGYTAEASDDPCQWAQDAVRSRCRALGLDTLEGVLLHRGEDMDREGIWNALAGSVAAGLCRTMGISTYYPEQASAAVARGASALQVTCNVLDNRFEASGVLRHAKEMGVTVYARSPFLQGLLLMAPEAVPDRLGFARKVVGLWREGVGKIGESPLSGALGYCVGQPDVDYVVMGAETAEQLQEILMLQINAHSREALFRLAETLRPVEERVILPFQWPAAQQEEQ